MRGSSKADKFTSWFRENGGHLHEGIRLLYSRELGYHYIAETRAISPKELVCDCPFSLTLSHLNVLPASPDGIRQCSAESICSKLVANKKIEMSTVAIFFLVEQRLRGKSSFWYPYIQLLPAESEMTTPLWFNENELAYLKGTNLLLNGSPRDKTTIGLRKRSYIEQWELGIAVLKSVGVPTDDFTWDIFLWAATIFSSRSFTSDLFTTAESANIAFQILYPVLDIFNHRIGAKVAWQFDNGSFSLYLAERVEQSQQIYNNYSPKSNEDRKLSLACIIASYTEREVLMGFGFCVPDNPHDQVAVRLSQVPPEVHRALRDALPSHWRSVTWKWNESDFYLRYPDPDTHDYTNIHGVPNLQCLRGIPPVLVKSVYIILKAHADSLVCDQKFVTEKDIWASTIDMLLRTLEDTLGGITRWDSELANLPLTAGARAALIYRTGQAKILTEIIAPLRAFIEPLEAGNIGVEDVF